ncbi:MAG: class I SAM-dependent methyltransferase [Thermoplasmatales archaeon]|jgi:SAM-dependent methyltransferase|nr:methyltransferase domain-containing protein [Candidatus Thermoplasmatota archaeon]MCL6003051.1 methyltransferase domain-containing protein [Candidatus Thermoplasmatota archaeon]MDA8054174.1 class I SAM-dependent methyltransferase [Thermoplasmatales archaeon]
MREIEDFYDFESTYYDKIYGIFSQDISFYKSMSATPPYLEIFAGTGRIISKFNGGIGLEINPNMLRKSVNSFIKVMGDARTLPFKKYFNTVIIGLNSLLLVPNEQKKSILSEARRVLNRNGFLFVDIINGFTLRRGTYDISKFNDGRTEISLKMKARRLRDRYQLRYSYSIFDQTKRSVEKTITIYPITPEELREMLTSENFEVDGTFGDYDLSPLELESEKLIVRAKAI